MKLIVPGKNLILKEWTHTLVEHKRNFVQVRVVADEQWYQVEYWFRQGCHCQDFGSNTWSRQFT